MTVRTASLITLVLVGIGLGARVLIGGDALFGGGSGGAYEVPLGGTVPDLFAVPALLAPPRPLDRARWLSLPARDPSGAVFGLTEGADGKEGVKLDEATGRVLWRVAVPRFLAGYERDPAWAKDERLPRLPIAEQSGDSYLLTWERQWILFDVTTGAIRAEGELPAGVPAVSAEGGVCPLPGKFWLAVEDGGRGGGILLDLVGRADSARVLRPAGCGQGVGQRDDQHTEDRLWSRSPQQNARQSSTPWPDSCRYYSSSGARGYHEVKYCSDMMTDADTSRDVLLHITNLAFHEAKDWRIVRFPMGVAAGEHVDFHGTPFAVELGVSAAFVDLGAYRFDELVLPSPPESFQADRRVKTTRLREVIAAIDRKGELRWARTLGVHDAEGGEGGLAGLLPHRSLLLASHPRSPVHNVYALKVGWLIAIDQDTGTPRFEVGEHR